MGFVDATIELFIGILAIVIVLGVLGVLAGSMLESMGSTVVMFTSALIVVLIAAAFLIYAKQSQDKGDSMISSNYAPNEYNY